MRKLFLVSAFLFWAVAASGQADDTIIVRHKAAGNTIGFVQKVSSTNTCPTDNADCSITVAAIGTTKHFGIIIAGMTANNTLSSVTGGGGTWIVESTCHHYYIAGGADISCAYNLLFDTASTTVTVTWNTATPVAPGFVFFEYSYTGTSVSFDVADVRNTAGSGNPLAGVALTPGGTNDVIAQGQFYDTATSIDPPYGNFIIFGSGTHGAAGDRMNTTDGTACSWNYAGATYGQFNAIAIKAN